MTKNMGDDLISGLKKLYKDEAAKAVFDWAANRRKDSRETVIDRLAYKADIQRHQAIRFARKLEELGGGKLVPGRHGAKTRFRWEYSLRAIGEIAQGKGVALKRIDPNWSDDDSDTDEQSDNLRTDRAADCNDITHAFQLRPDKPITIALPNDLTSKEAERLASFIQSLPFDG